MGEEGGVALFDRTTHRPVEQAILFEIDQRTAVETALCTVLMSVPDERLEQVGVNALPDEVFVRPLRHCLCESPLFRVNKGP